MIAFISALLMFAAGIRLLIMGGSVRIILALLFLGNAGNIFVFRFTSMIKGAAPIIGPHDQTLSGTYADPLPQALVLTAIVIGLGVTLFLAAMMAAMLRNTQGEDET